MIQGSSPNTNSSSSDEEIKDYSLSETNSKRQIFLIKKYHRKGLLEKKIMKTSNNMNMGKWSREEHNKFIRASLKHGTNWKKVNLLRN